MANRDRAVANLDGYEPGKVDTKSLQLSLEDRWIMSRLSKLTKEVGRNLTTYRFNDAARDLYEFAWGEFIGAILPGVLPAVLLLQVLRVNPLIGFKRYE